MAVVVIQEFEATPEECDQVSEKLGELTPEGRTARPGTEVHGAAQRLLRLRAR